MKESGHIAKRRRETVDALFCGEGTLDEVLAEQGVAAATFFSWMDDPAFATYLQKQIRARTDAAVLSAWKSLLRGVERGECSAIKLFFEMKGRGDNSKTACDIRMDDGARKAAV